MGLASLWVSDRLLLPTRPKETFDGDPWPEIFATVYDPIEMLTFAAARTRKVKLGTSVLSGSLPESCDPRPAFCYAR